MKGSLFWLFVEDSADSPLNGKNPVASFAPASSKLVFQPVRTAFFTAQYGEGAWGVVYRAFDWTAAYMSMRNFIAVTEGMEREWKIMLVWFLEELKAAVSFYGNNGSPARPAYLFHSNNMQPFRYKCPKQWTRE